MRPLACLAGTLLLAGCPHTPSDRGPPRPSHVPAIASFTEASPVTAVLPVPPFALVGTASGLDRFDLHGGQVRHYGLAEGLPGTAVLAFAAAGRDVWILCDGGVATYDLATGALTQAPLLPEAAAGVTHIAVDARGGVWLGGPRGLFRLDLAAGWQSAGYTRAVTALWADGHGNVWLGSAGTVVVRRSSGAFAAWGADDGLVLASVDLILESPEGRPLVVGKDAAGRPRLAVAAGERFAIFRTSPEVQILGGTRKGDALVLATPRRLYALSAPRKGAQMLRRDGMHLVSAAAAPRRSPYEARPLDVTVPRDPTALAATESFLFLGTHALGVAQLVDAQGARPRWLRRRDLVEGATDLSVACHSAGECYLAVGTARAWKYDGKAFTRFSPAPPPADPALAGAEPSEVVTLSLVRAPDGAVLALYRDPADAERKLRVARLDHGVFAPLTDLAIEAPGGVAALTFARFSPEGLLWLGLEVLDAEQEPIPYGAATIDLSLNLVTYHRQEEGLDARATGVLPVPNDVIDVAFMPNDETWFATASGAARLIGDQVTVFTEEEGLESEILHGIVATDGGLVFVASGHGVGQFDGARWTFPKRLGLSANALARGLDGRLWMGTDRGLLAYDGQRLQRISERAGLLASEERVADVCVDHLGRVWARTAQGVSIVTP